MKRKFRSAPAVPASIFSTPTVSRLLLALVAGCTLLTIAGCGGGASLKPGVTFLPGDPEEPEPEAEEEMAGEVTSTTESETTPAPAEMTAAAPTAEPVKETPATPAPATETPVTGGFGTIRGRVVVQGEFTALPPIYEKNAAPKDPAVCGIESAPNQSAVVNNGGLANVFIYLGKVPKDVEIPAPPATVEFDQRHCVFAPHVLVVQTGQLIKVLNDDAVAHNTHTYPKRNTPFNKTVAPNDRAGIELTYGRPETQPLQVGCDIHPWMIAYHLPVDHPWATVSAADGSFEIRNVPSGSHEFKIWHEKGGELERALAITVKPNETVEIEIPVATSKLSQFQGPASRQIQLSSTR